MNVISDCHLVQLPKFGDPRGNLSVIQQNEHVPFAIARVHWIYDAPGGTNRAGHAYRCQSEFIVALSGSFDVTIDDSHEKRITTLNRSYCGMYIPCGIWRTLSNFSTNAVCLILSSTSFDEADYIRDYNEFISSKHNSR